MHVGKGEKVEDKSSTERVHFPDGTSEEYTHTRTHTHTYIYIYVYTHPKFSRKKKKFYLRRLAYRPSVRKRGDSAKGTMAISGAHATREGRASTHVSTFTRAACMRVHIYARMNAWV